MSYSLPPIPHAVLSSALIQIPALTTLAYPMLFESDDDLTGFYRQTGSITVNNSTPAACTISWTAHKLSIGAAVWFTSLVGGTGISASTPYYVATTDFGVDSFKLCTAYTAALTANVVTSATGTATCECISRIYTPVSGDFLFNLSAIVATTTNTDATFDVWFVKGNSTDNLAGTIIPSSDTQVLMVTTGQRVVLAVPFILDMIRGDYIRLDMRTGSAGNLGLVAVAASSTPTRPARPSTLITVQKIGR
jgi:hypothetical protein